MGSGFTFLKNAENLYFPYIQSIKSIITICNEFVIALGKSKDLSMIKIKFISKTNKKIKIINTEWNKNMKIKGYTYAQQKMISQFHCTGKWLFYLEGDEIIHEKDLKNIYKSLKIYIKYIEIESIAFKYYHFYGNINTYLYSPHWYRYAPRIIKSNVRS